jgi:hypothetical protein
MTLTVTGGLTSPTQSTVFPTPVQQTWSSVQVYASNPANIAAAAKIRNLVIVPPAALPVSYYPTASFSSGVTLAQSNLVGVVALPAQYTVRFDLYPTADNSDYRNIIHLSASGDKNISNGKDIHTCQTLPYMILGFVQKI